MKLCWLDPRPSKEFLSIPPHFLRRIYFSVYVLVFLCAGCSDLSGVPAITTFQMPVAHAGSPYSIALSAVGGVKPYQWILASGTLPPGVTLDRKTGALSGIPSQPGEFRFTVQVIDSKVPLPAMGLRALRLVVSGPPPQITTNALPNAQAGAAFQASLGAAGGTPPYHWSLASGALPSGLSLSDAGRLSGTPSQPGQFDFTVQLSDSSSPKPQNDMKSLRLAVVTLALQIVPSSLPNGEVGAPFRATLSASGGVAPYTWSVAGALPSGLSLNASSGAIAGTPTAAGSFSFTAQVADSSSAPLTASSAFILSIVDPSASAALDQFGGDAQHPCAGTLKDGKAIPGATGFFYLYKDTNLKHWMFCDPLGNRFWMTAVQLVGGMTQGFYDIVGPKYASNPGGWTAQEATRLKSLGFNTIGEYANLYMWPVGTYGHGGNTNQMPFIHWVSPGIDYWRHDVKDVVFNLPPAYTEYKGETFPDVFDPQWTSADLPAYFGDTGVSNPFNGSGGYAAADASPWLIGTTLDDSDALWGFKGFQGPYPHIAWMVWMMPPYHGWYSDTTVHIKQQFSGYLQSKYATIGALNTAWGSSYSSFNSSATTVTSESVGTGTGAQTSFNHTLAHTPVDPVSISIFVAGTLQGADCPWFNQGCQASSGTGAMDGAGSKNVNGGTVTYSSGVMTVTFSTAPANGAAITVNYQYGGWPKATAGGTGFLDEDGTSSWFIADPPDPAPGTIGADLDGFLGQIAKQYFSTVAGQLRAKLPHHMIFGPNPLGPRTRGPILAQAAQYLDAVMMEMEPIDNTSSQPFDYRPYAITAYNTYGLPAYAYEIKAANPDSPYPGTNCRIPNDCFSTQAARGASYKNDLSAYFNTYVGADGYRFAVGLDYWQFTDNSSESANFGLVTLRDNFYNGTESCGKSVKDPWGFTTTPEPTTGCYGDFISLVKAGNRIWLGP